MRPSPFPSHLVTKANTSSSSPGDYLLGLTQSTKLLQQYQTKSTRPNSASNSVRATSLIGLVLKIWQIKFIFEMRRFLHFRFVFYIFVSTLSFSTNYSNISDKASGQWLSFQPNSFSEVSRVCSIYKIYHLHTFSYSEDASQIKRKTCWIFYQKWRKITRKSLKFK